MKEFSKLMDWNDGKIITVYEENKKLYVNDNFGISSEKINIDRWLSIYEIFFGKDKNYDLIKMDKKFIEG